MFAYFCLLGFFVAVIFIIDINIFERSVWIHMKNFVKINTKYKFK